MAIVLEVQPYCAACVDFEADVSKPDKITCLDGTIILSNTVVRCKYAKRCENIRKYLTRLDKDMIKDIPINLA